MNDARFYETISLLWRSCRLTKQSHFCGALPVLWTVRVCMKQSGFCQAFRVSWTTPLLWNNLAFVNHSLFFETISFLWNSLAFVKHFPVLWTTAAFMKPSGFSERARLLWSTSPFMNQSRFSQTLRLFWRAATLRSGREVPTSAELTKSNSVKTCGCLPAHLSFFPIASDHTKAIFQLRPLEMPQPRKWVLSVQSPEHSSFSLACHPTKRISLSSTKPDWERQSDWLWSNWLITSKRSRTIKG
jgi:hypothetical protein